MKANTLRVLHVVPGYLPAQGGIESLVDGVTPTLESVHGIHSSILVPRFWNERPREFTNNGMVVHSIDMPQRHSLESPTTRAVRLFRDTRQAISQANPDIIHCHGIGHLFAPTTMIAQSMNVPLIHHIHGDLTPETRETHRKTLQNSPHVWAVSHSVARSITRVANREAHVEVIPNGIVPLEPRTSASTAPLIAMVGRLEGPKGFHHGLAAVARLQPLFPDVHVVIVGVGEELLELQRVAGELGLASAVHFHGRLGRAATQEVLASASVVIIPSLMIEGFSLVAAESAFLEKPVVAYKVAGLSETILDGKTGTLVPPGDIPALANGISAYLDSQKTRRAVGMSARARAMALFNVDRFARQLARGYQSVHSEKKGTE